MNKLQLLCLALMMMSMSDNATGQNQGVEIGCKKSEIVKRAKKRAKGMKKQGYQPDINLGTPEEQFVKRIQYECTTFMPDETAQQKSPRYTLESFTATAPNESNAMTKARDGARRQLGANAGNTFQGIIETERAFLNTNDEDMRNELEQAIGSFDEIFESELNKNVIITQFYRRENNGNYTYNVCISLDNLQLANDIRKLKKEDLQKRIERVRKKKEKLFGN